MIYLLEISSYLCAARRALTMCPRFCLKVLSLFRLKGTSLFVPLVCLLASEADGVTRTREPEQNMRTITLQLIHVRLPHRVGKQQSFIGQQAFADDAFSPLCGCLHALLVPCKRYQGQR